MHILRSAQSIQPQFIRSHRILDTNIQSLPRDLMGLDRTFSSAAATSLHSFLFLRWIPIHPESVWHCVIKLWHQHKKHGWILILLPSTTLDCMFRSNPSHKTYNTIIIKSSTREWEKIDKWYIWLQWLMAWCCFTRSDCQLFGKNHKTWTERLQ